MYAYILLFTIFSFVNGFSGLVTWSLDSNPIPLVLMLFVSLEAAAVSEALKFVRFVSEPRVPLSLGHLLHGLKDYSESFIDFIRVDRCILVPLGLLLIF